MEGRRAFIRRIEFFLGLLQEARDRHRQHSPQLLHLKQQSRQLLKQLPVHLNWVASIQVETSAVKDLVDGFCDIAELLHVLVRRLAYIQQGEPRLLVCGECSLHQLRDYLLHLVVGLCVHDFYLVWGQLPVRLTVVVLQHYLYYVVNFDIDNILDNGGEELNRFILVVLLLVRVHVLHLLGLRAAPVPVEVGHQVNRLLLLELVEQLVQKESDLHFALHK